MNDTITVPDTAHISVLELLAPDAANTCLATLPIPGSYILIDTARAPIIGEWVAQSGHCGGLHLCLYRPGQRIFGVVTYVVTPPGQGLEHMITKPRSGAAAGSTK
jgi:hypothetical protein